MRIKIILICIFFSYMTVICQSDKWEPQKQVTGYLSFEGNFFNNLKFFDRDYAVSMPESGILINYQPLKKLNFTGIFIYRPTFELRNMVSEISAEWTENRFLKIKAGHQLTPLSPINTSFYAPVNMGIVMPMIVSIHDYYPTNMEALSVSGSVGNKLRISYCVMGGGYFASFMLRNGAMNFFGVEDYYFRALDNDTIIEDFSSYFNSDDLHYGFGGHLRFSYEDYAMIGLNAFRAEEILYWTASSLGIPIVIYAYKQAYGINFNFQYNTVKLIGEAWIVTIHDQDNFNLGDRNGLFVELSNSFGNFTPYFKYELRHVQKNPYAGGQVITDFTRYIAGLNYKPNFEITLKLEYFAYNKYQLNGILMAVNFAFLK